MATQDLEFQASSATIGSSYDRNRVTVSVDSVELSEILTKITIRDILAEFDEDDFLEEIGCERAKIYWNLEG